MFKLLCFLLVEIKTDLARPGPVFWSFKTAAAVVAVVVAAVVVAVVVAALL